MELTPLFSYFLSIFNLKTIFSTGIIVQLTNRLKINILMKIKVY
jgi:hypothetical protein